MASLDSQEFEIYIEKVKILGLFNVKRKRKRAKNSSVSSGNHGSDNGHGEEEGNEEVRKGRKNKNNKNSQVPKLPEITTRNAKALGSNNGRKRTTAKTWHHHGKSDRDQQRRHNNLPAMTSQHGYDTLFERPSNIRSGNFTLPPIHPPPEADRKRKKKIKFHLHADDVTTTTTKTTALQQQRGERSSTRKRMTRQSGGDGVIAAKSGTANGAAAGAGKREEARAFVNTKRKSSLPVKLAASQEPGKQLTKKRNMEDRTMLKKRESDSQVIIQRCRYKKIVNVYLDQKWHKERREQFYRKLEAQQSKMMNERRWKVMQREKGVNEALERQREQLNELRQKHALEKEKRIATQHVKWKFISEENDDRRKYGLPNNIPIGTSQGKQQLRKVNENKSKSSITDIRRRNEARYEYIFQSVHRPPLSKTALQLGR